MNAIVINNYSKLKLSLIFLPLSFLLAIALYLYSQHSLHVNKYIQIQKHSFLFINSRLSQFPHTEYNLTQFGDAMIFLSFLSIFIVYAPKLWESLFSVTIISALVSCSIKKIFAVPRPAAALNKESFVIIGKALCGNNSLPSGHSITIFSILTVLLFAFVPKKRHHKTLWFFAIIFIGLLLVFTRVAVGAHYPLDVLIGATVGYISGILGIFISQKYKIWSWIGNKKFYPIFIVLLLVCCICTINRIINDNLIIFYFSLLSLVVSLYKITTVYVQK